MKKVLAFVGIAVLISSAAVADINPANGPKVLNPDYSAGSRANGTLGSLTITATQVGALQVQVDASVTTQGGDGVPVTVSFGGNTYVLNNQIYLYGQIYDSPWDGGCTSWATSPGTDWCAHGDQYFMNSPNALGSFALSFTTAVPSPANYQTFVMAAGGLTWITTGYNWFSVSQSTRASAVSTIYVDSTQPPTPTPDPNAGGNPIPTLNWLGMLAMVAMLFGVAILVFIRRK